MGFQGPDQGYVLRLVHQFEHRVHLQENEHREDAEAGCIGVALKRASIFGRAPVVHDLTVALTAWGFLDERPAPELVEQRRRMFAEVRSPHHYPEQRAIVDAVPDSTLRMSHTEVIEAHRRDWRSLLDLP
jgi:hypothetical protein